MSYAIRYRVAQANCGASRSTDALRRRLEDTGRQAIHGDNVLHHLAEELDLGLIHGRSKFSNAPDAAEGDRPAADDVSGVDAFIEQVHRATDDVAFRRLHSATFMRR